MSGKQDIPKPKMDDPIKNWQLITDKNMNILILFGLIFAGIFIKLFLGNNTSENSGQASSTIWGYGLTTIALFTLMFTILSSNNGNILELIFKNGLPIFALIIILIYIISINFTYFQILNKNFVPNEFHTYSKIW